MKKVLDYYGKELQVGDLVYYGIKVNSKGSRGSMEVGTITKLEGSYVCVDTSYYRMNGNSCKKCGPKFASMYKDGTIFEIA